MQASSPFFVGLLLRRFYKLSESFKVLKFQLDVGPFAGNKGATEGAF